MMTSAPWYDFWVTHPTITLQRTFDAAAKNLTAPNGAPGIIRLRPRRDSNGALIGFAVASSHLELPAGWEGVTLAPMGSDAIQAVGTPLPAFVDPVQHELLYAAALQSIVDQLHVPETQLQRLEGHFPVVDLETGSFNVDRVRIVNISGLVAGPRDHSLLVLSLLETHGLTSMQDGGASGPPN